MKTFETFKLAKTATAVAALALSAGAAHAVPSPSVTQWSIVDVAVFDPTSVLPAGNTFPNPVLSNGNTELRWGNATNQSGLIIDNTGSPFLVDTGVLASTISITHDNFPIPPGNSLTSVDINGLLTLTSVAPPPDGPTVGPVLLPFQVSFLETPNNGTAGVCADGGTPFAAGINVNGCSDIFVIDVESLNFPFLYDSDGVGVGDPVLYFLSIFADGFGTLSDAACTSVLGAGNNGCRGFQTAENLSTTAVFKLLITETPFETPEPGSLALMGLGMASLGWIGRRRKQKQG